jgi:TetR/AcrR family transcriptional regulator, transcriptional repressor for nem operon
MGRTGQAREKLLESALEALWANSYGKTSVEDLCQVAGVQKGSFYHYFSSKAELVNAVILHEWETKFAPIYDRCFSASKPPLQRLLDMADELHTEQSAIQQRHGRVLGCPLMSLAMEVSTTEHELAETIDTIFQYFHRYLLAIVRDAQAEGLIRVVNIEQTAQVLHRYIDGAISQARIKNTLEPLAHLGNECLQILGAEIKPASRSLTKVARPVARPPLKKKTVRRLA